MHPHTSRMTAKQDMPIHLVVRLRVGGFGHTVNGQARTLGQIQRVRHQRFVALPVAGREVDFRNVRLNVADGIAALLVLVEVFGHPLPSIRRTSVVGME